MRVGEAGEHSAHSFIRSGPCHLRWDARAGSKSLRAAVSSPLAGPAAAAGLVLAIAPRPDVLILDEPAANLDVVRAPGIPRSDLDLIRDGEKDGVSFDSYPSDVEQVADHVGIPSGGRLIVEESLDDLKESCGRSASSGFRVNCPEQIPGALNVCARAGEKSLRGTQTGAGQRIDGCSAAKLGCQAEVRGTFARRSLCRTHQEQLMKPFPAILPHSFATTPLASPWISGSLPIALGIQPAIMSTMGVNWGSLSRRSPGRPCRWRPADHSVLRFRHGKNIRRNPGADDTGRIQQTQTFSPVTSDDESDRIVRSCFGARWVFYWILIRPAGAAVAVTIFGGLAPQESRCR